MVFTKRLKVYNKQSVTLKINTVTSYLFNNAADQGNATPVSLQILKCLLLRRWWRSHGSRLQKQHITHCTSCSE